MQREITVQELVDGMAVEIQQWKGMLAIVLKSQGGSMVINRKDSEVEAPYDIALRRVDNEKTTETQELELKLLEGKEEIESTFGKPSPIIIPK